VAKVKDHLKSAEEFYALGTKEYEEGHRKGDLTRMREGCEKIFHAYVEVQQLSSRREVFQSLTLIENAGKS